MIHCPRCGSQQTSDKIRFCTRCGLALGDIKELLVHESRETKTKNKSRKGLRQGLTLFLFGLVLISVLAVLRDFNVVSEIFVKIAALVFCVGGVVRMCFPFIYNRGILLEKNDSSLEINSTEYSLTGAEVTADLLTPAKINPIEDFAAQKFDTAKIVQPLSITEHTTKLFKEQL